MLEVVAQVHHTDQGQLLHPVHDSYSTYDTTSLRDDGVRHPSGFVLRQIRTRLPRIYKVEVRLQRICHPRRYFETLIRHLRSIVS